MLDLGVLVRLAGVLDGELMQVELRLHAPQELVAGFEEADPDDMAGSLRPVAGLVDRDVGDALAAGIDARRDDAGLIDRRCRRGYELNESHVSLPWLPPKYAPVGAAVEKPN